MGKNLRGIIVGCLLAATVVSGIIALILSLVNWTDVYPAPVTKYGMVFDAGSSHTSLYIYQWPADKENDTGIVTQVYTCDSPGGGISSYTDDPSKAGESLKSCLDEAMKIIPDKQHQETPTLLGATAGMRLLRLQNVAKAEKVLEEVSKAIQQYPVNFQGARILTGNEEGSLGWITVNYLLQTFIKYSFTGQWIHPKPEEILGAMDLGGASTQMTFRPSSAISDKSTEMFFRLYGYDYTVYTHSYLCYGKDQALNMLLGKLRESQSGDTVNHPCFPKGYQSNVTLASLYASPCVNTTTSYMAGALITVSGTGDPVKCKSALDEIFNFTACGGRKNCTFGGTYQPPVEGQFYAFSAFYYTFSFLNLTSGQSLNTANTTIWQFCTEDWQTLKERYPKENPDRLSNYCATGLYILTLLLDAYKFDSQTWSNINFRKQAANTDIGWTLGYMLNLTNKVPSEAPAAYIGHPHSIWAAAVFFIVLSIVLGLVAAPLHCLCRNKG